MKIIKWGLFFIVAFLVSFALLRTFSQDVFKQFASARAFGYVSAPVPLYYFVAIAFLTGLGIGLITALYNYIRGSAALYKKMKHIKELEEELEFYQLKIAKTSAVDMENKFIEENLKDTQYSASVQSRSDEKRGSNSTASE